MITATTAPRVVSRGMGRRARPAATWTIGSACGAPPTSTPARRCRRPPPWPMTDESGQTFPFTVDPLLRNALGASGYYAVLTANMHTDTASHAGSDAILAPAHARGA